MPRFVLLRHELPPESPRTTHFDLMFEQGGTLRTWACERIPEPGQSIQAEQLPDHRLAYLEYEGPVSGNRGSVTRVDAGEYELVAESADRIQVRLAGSLLRGMLTLTREAAGSQRWSLVLASESSCE